MAIIRSLPWVSRTSCFSRHTLAQDTDLQFGLSELQITDPNTVKSCLIIGLLFAVSHTIEAGDGHFWCTVMVTRAIRLTSPRHS